MGSTSVPEAVKVARRQFFGEGRLSQALVAEPIMRSWQRCARLGLDRASQPPIEPMTQHELREIAEPHERLRRACRPEFLSLLQDAEATDAIVLLTDPSGVVLDALGSTDFAARAARVALRPGVRWNEAATGTNAIGTALVEHRPIEVLGSEHFFDAHAILSCAAVPIFDPEGKVAGVLDISGPSAVDHRHALGLARLAVEQIEHRLFEGRFEGADIVRFQCDPALIGTAREGILVFRESRLVAANRYGLKLMNLDWSALGAHRIDELFNELPQERTGIGKARDHHGKPIFARRSTPRILAKALPSRPAGPQAPTQSVPWFDAAGQAMLAKAIRLLHADISFLVTGETGTGKEVFARHVHEQSIRAKGPFVAVNCAALPENLIEAELFGYAEGAFTGAHRQGRKGLIREASGGTLFLDEIGDMPLMLQTRLLRVLQDHKVTPLGGGATAEVDFAVICASHRDLAGGVEAGSFRQDLYFRLAQYAFEMPALRNRADRGALIDALSRQHLGQVPLSPEAEQMLAAYDWPGNLRQLVGTLKALRALAAEGESVGVDMLPAPIRMAPAKSATGPAEPLSRLEAIEKQAMRRALDEHEGNVSRAAKALGVNRSTLYRRLLTVEKTA